MATFAKSNIDAGETKVLAGGRRLPLHSPSDATYLSPLVCLMRSQLEVFSATQADVEARSSFGALVQTIGVGRVGIRCVHCRDRPAADQAKGAVSYPASIRMLHQATRNWQRFHWAACKFIPSSAREEFERLKAGKKANSSRKSTEYWIRRSGEMGLVDTAAAACAAATTSSSPDCTSADSGGALSYTDRPVEPDGIYFEEDARKLGLRMLLLPDEKGTAAAKKQNSTRPRRNQGKKRKDGTNGTSSQSDTTNEGRQVIANGLGLGAAAINNETSGQPDQRTAAMSAVNFESLGAFPVQAMGKDFSLDDLGDDASLLLDLERLAGEDGGNNDDDDISSIGISENIHDRKATSSQASANGGMNAVTRMDRMESNQHSTTERDLKLLSTLRAAREMVRSLSNKYPDETSSLSLGSQMASDLHALGEALYRALEDEGSTSAEATPVTARQMAEDANANKRLPKRERRRYNENKPGRGTVPLQELGYPTNVSIFVQSMIDATDEDAPERFTSLSDVDNDLQLMIEFPDKYLFDALPEASTGRLEFSSELYGLQTQRNKLMKAFQSVVVTREEHCGLALISGRSGSGKTSLVTLIHPLRERRGMLIEIKFDKKENQSIPSIIRALDQYCHDLQGDLDLFSEVGAAVKSTLGSFSQVLLSLMPNLSPLVGEVSSILPAIDNKEKYHLFFNCLQGFVRAISAPSHPLVLFFDDLQWADAESLDFVSKIIRDPETRSCLFVGCYRDNEVLTDHPLLEYLGDIAFAGVPMWQIFQESIGMGSINELLSDTFHLMPRITTALARELHKKTGGNPHFAKQLLQSLHDDRLVQYSPSARRWQWDISAIRSKNVPDNAVALLLERMTQYGTDVQRVLQIAALMGRRFDASALKMFQAGGDADGDGSAILGHIDTIVGDGLVCIDKTDLRFAHDSIWEAALSLTPVSERERMKLLIGRQMLNTASNSDSCTSLDIHLQLVVDQMNSGSSLIEAYDEKLRLAELNLKVGQEALAAYSFLEASSYLLQGSTLLTVESWDSHYQLCLEIFTACAEAQLAYGNNDGAIISANAVILHGRCLNDKLSAHYTIYTALYTQGKLEDVWPKAICVLDELGIRLPPLETQIESATIKSELRKTEKLLWMLRPEDIVARPIMPEESGESLSFMMKISFNLCQIFYVTKPDFLSLIVFRMVQMTLDRPMTSESSFAFAAYSNILCNLGLRDRSATCAQIALTLLDKFHGMYFQSLVLALAVSIWPYRQPWHACLDSCQRAILVDATSVGDMSMAVHCQKHISSMHHFVPAGSLQDAFEKLNECQRNLMANGNPNFFAPTIYLQVTLNLITSDDVGTDPTILQGDATGQKDMLSILPQSNTFYERLVRKADFARLYLGYLFRRHDVVLEVASNVKGHLMESKNEPYPAFELLLETFYVALAAYSIIRQGSNNKSEDWQNTADELTNEMKDLSENDSKWNFQQKYLLLEAEKAFTDGNVEIATASYDKAIEAAREHRFINEQALASECAALFYLDHENVDQARRYLEEARDLYGQWGAHRKVGDIEEPSMALALKLLDI